VIDAIRFNLGVEIDRVIAELDEIRIRQAGSTVLDRAICSAFGARVNLNSAPFHETLRHLDAARTLLARLTGSTLSN
jgi:hypothetical protein